MLHCGPNDPGDGGFVQLTDNHPCYDCQVNAASSVVELTDNHPSYDCQVNAASSVVAVDKFQTSPTVTHTVFGPSFDVSAISVGDTDTSFLDVSVTVPDEADNCYSAHDHGDNDDLRLLNKRQQNIHRQRQASRECQKEQAERMVKRSRVEPSPRTDRRQRGCARSPRRQGERRSQKHYGDYSPQE
eukprot:TRINITY_DN40408_c0_g1_i14.p1 TRINITY_DN40408_c0_g1~~TRINITY_DN40408_c0_g1_i14.p1  ORF type:complete len:186 (-),score=28.76 TRINITY_DN40408_c0_g1_i14:406-963(-)